MNISPKLKNKKIGVLMGGNSNERDISIKSGNSVLKALKKYDLDVVPVELKANPKKKIQSAKIDVAFLTTHGKGGEDGKLQKILDSLKIPYTGSDAKASKVIFNKWDTKNVLLKNKISTPNAMLFNKRGYKSKIKNLVFPIFLKPLEEGSSIGVHLLNDRRTVEDDIKKAFKGHEKLIVEEKIFGREITVGILGKKPLPIVEIKPKKNYFDFEAKYQKGMTKYSLEPSFKPAQVAEFQKIALKVFKALNGRDFARVDMVVDSFGTPFVLEMNSIPGFTETSLLPMAAKKEGLDFPDLCVQILNYVSRRV